MKKKLRNINKFTCTNISFIILLLFIFNNKVISQTITGEVRIFENKLAKYVNVIVVDLNDSTFIKGGCFPEGKYIIEDIGQTEFLLKISYLGYKVKYVKLNSNLEDTINLDIINLEPDTLLLKAISIEGKVPLVEMNNNGKVLNVSSTILKNAETIDEILKYAPGVIKKDGKINIFGKGEPLFLLNGNTIQSNNQLDMLNPQDIKKIEILDTPSSKFDAKYKAVINIILKKNFKKGYGVKLYNNLTIANYITNYSSIALNFNAKKVNHYFMYKYSNGGKRGYENSNTSIFENDKLFFKNSFSSIEEEKSRKNNYLYIGEYKHNEKHRIGFQLYGHYKINEEEALIETNIEEKKEKIINFKNYLNNKSKKNFNSLNINHTFTLDSLNKIQTSVDYSLHKSISKGFFDERFNDTIFNKELDYNIQHEIYSFKIDYYSEMGNNINLTTGIKGSWMNAQRNSEFKENKEGVLVYNKVFSNEIIQKENTYSGYVSINKKINQISLNAGLRLEYDNQKLENIDSTFLNLTNTRIFPSLSLYYAISKKLKLNISYSKKIKRPDYNTLSDGLVYVNRFLYREGNGYLKPTIYNNFDINLNAFNFSSIYLGYSKENNYSTLSFSNSGNTIIARSLNFNRERLYTGINFFLNNSIFSTNNGIYFSKSIFNYTFLENDISTKKIGYVITSDNTIKILKFIDLYINAQYSNMGDVDFITLDPQYTLKIGVRKYLFSKNLRIAVYGNIGSSQKYTAKLNNIYISHRFKEDINYIRFTIRYYFNNYKNKRKFGTSQDEEIQRL